MAPVTAAAAVVAVALSLVIVREISNGPVVPPAGSGSASGVPRYYGAISGAKFGWYAYAPLTVQPNDLVVGDTVTGKKLATIGAPTGTEWEGVTAAADDRTFAARRGRRDGAVRVGQGTRGRHRGEPARNEPEPDRRQEPVRLLGGDRRSGPPLLVDRHD
jgi:hypothetical protein